MLCIWQFFFDFGLCFLLGFIWDEILLTFRWVGSRAIWDTIASNPQAALCLTSFSWMRTKIFTFLYKEKFLNKLWYFYVSPFHFIPMFLLFISPTFLQILHLEFIWNTSHLGFGVLTEVLPSVAGWHWAICLLPVSQSSSGQSVW